MFAPSSSRITSKEFPPLQGEGWGEDGGNERRLLRVENRRDVNEAGEGAIESGDSQLADPLPPSPFP